MQVAEVIGGEHTHRVLRDSLAVYQRGAGNCLMLNKYC
jgi:hypothetical protein